MTTVAWDLAGFDDHGGDPAEHVSGEGAEGLHEVGILCPRTEGEDFSQRCRLGEGTWESWCPALHRQGHPTWTQNGLPADSLDAIEMDLISGELKIAIHNNVYLQ